MENITLQPLSILEQIRLRFGGPQSQDAQPYASPNRGVQFLYAFGQSPCVYAYHADGTVYRMLLDGTTFLRSGESELLMPGCPHPQQVLWTGHFRNFVWHNRTRLPLLALVLACLVVLQIVLGNLPELGEVNRYFIGIFSWVINLALLALALVGLVVAICFYAGNGIIRAVTRVEEGGPAGLLGPGALSIGQDLLLCSAEGESADQWAARVDAAMQDIGNRWLLIVPFRSPIAMVIIPASDGQALPSEGVRPGQSPQYFEEQFPRTSPPFPVVVPAISSAYLSETFQQYQNYLSAICPPFMAWAAERKALVRSAADMAKQYVGCLAFLLLSLACVAQPKSKQVGDYLGHRAEMPAPAGDIAFVFERSELTRFGDGKKTYLELLQGARVFTDADDSGRLQAIFAGEAKIEPVRGEAQPTRAASVTQPVSALPIPISIDSAGFSNSLDEGGRAVGSAFRAANSVMKKWWQSDLCTYLLHIIAALAGTLHMVAQICYNEHRMTQWGHLYGRWAFNIGNAASFALMFVTLPTLVAVALLIYIAFVEYEGFALYYIFCLLWNVWTLLLILWFVLIRMIVKFADFIIPNPKVRPTHGGPSYPVQHPPRLEAGQ